MDFWGYTFDAWGNITNSDLTPYDANIQPFITPLTYIAVTTGNIHLLAMLGVGT